MAANTYHSFGTCPVHGPDSELTRAGSKFFCTACGIAPAPFGYGVAITAARTIATPNRIKHAETCSAKCTTGKHSCSCKCGGRCHGAGTCYCAD